MLSAYRATLALPGARTLTLVCALAWLTTSTYGLGLVLLLEATTGSFATAGLGAGAFALGTALLAPWRGRLVDRRGPGTLWPLTALHLGALAALIAAADRLAALTATALALLAGSFAPPLIAVARTRWAELTATAAHGARPGHALNAALGDLANVLGPALVATLALLIGPAAALAIFLPGLAVAAAILGRGRSTRAPRSAPDRLREPRRWPRGMPGGAGFRMLLAAETLLAIGFGALDLAAPAAGAAQGSPSAGAAALGAFAAGSAAAGLWSGAVQRVGAPQRRLLAGLAVMAASLGLVSVVPAVAAIALAAVPAGVGAGLAFVAVLELLDEVVPPGRSTEAFTWLTAGGGAGAAAGSVVSGHLAAAGAIGAALLLSSAAAATAAIWVAVASAHVGADGRGHPPGDQCDAPTSSSVG